jgi:taurine dioxygenase
MQVEAKQPFGVDVTGVDLRGPTSDDTARLVGMFEQCGLLVVRDQELDPEEHAAATEIFGPVFDERGTGKPTTYVSNVREDSVAPGGPSPFHQDASFLRDPFPAISLHAVHADEGAAATCFASNTNAYEVLPDTLRAQADRCSALHEFAAELREATGPSDADVSVRATVHPVVMRDGLRPYLFVNPVHTKRIVELDDPESAALQVSLQAVIFDPANIVEHRWRTGDFVIWDNKRVQHARTEGAPDAVRDLSRTVVGNAATAEQYRNFMRWYRPST